MVTWSLEGVAPWYGQSHMWPSRQMQCTHQAAARRLFDRAISSFREALHASPNHPAVLSKLGHTLRQKAIALVRAPIAAVTSSARVFHVWLGCWVQQGWGDLQGALACAQDAEKVLAMLHPSNLLQVCGCGCGCVCVCVWLCGCVGRAGQWLWNCGWRQMFTNLS